jgi:hypothetical protein
MKQPPATDEDILTGKYFHVFHAGAVETNPMRGIRDFNALRELLEKRIHEG